MKKILKTALNFWAAATIATVSSWCNWLKPNVSLDIKKDWICKLVKWKASAVLSWYYDDESCVNINKSMENTFKKDFIKWENLKSESEKIIYYWLDKKEKKDVKKDIWNIESEARCDEKIFNKFTWEYSIDKTYSWVIECANLYNNAIDELWILNLSDSDLKKAYKKYAEKEISNWNYNLSIDTFKKLPYNIQKSFLEWWQKVIQKISENKDKKIDVDEADLKKKYDEYINTEIKKWNYVFIKYEDFKKIKESEEDTKTDTKKETSKWNSFLD